MSDLVVARNCCMARIGSARTKSPTNAVLCFSGG